MRNAWRRGVIGFVVGLAFAYFVVHYVPWPYRALTDGAAIAAIVTVVAADRLKRRR